ncbi:MAG: VOC family protein [Stellaceae bacterium]
MITLQGIGHVNLRVADQEASKRFYRDVLGFRIAEEDPEHGGVFMTLGDKFPYPRSRPAPGARERAAAAARADRSRPYRLSGRELRRPARRLPASPCQQRHGPARCQPRQPAQLLF